MIHGESLRSQEIQGFFHGKILKKNTYVKQLSIKIFTYEGYVQCPFNHLPNCSLSEKSYVRIG